MACALRAPLKQKESMYLKWGRQSLLTQVPSPEFRRTMSLHHPSASLDRSLPRLLQASTMAAPNESHSLFVSLRFGSSEDWAVEGDSAGGASFVPQPRVIIAATTK